MSVPKKALVLIGSPKGRTGISEKLGSALIKRLEMKGVECKKDYIYASLATAKGRESLLESVSGADLIVFSYPLYVDSLPASMIEAMEIIADWVSTRDGVDLGLKKLATIVQSGFPEASQNETSLAICRRFAKEAGFTWAGGLKIGEGPALERVDFSKPSGMGGGLKKALTLMASALANGEDVPSKAVELAAKPLVPFWLYRFIGDRGWKSQAKKNKADKNLYVKPLADGK